MSAIKRVQGRQILHSRGNPTVEVEVALLDGTFARAAVPSGASTGEHEAVELRDGGAAYGGKGVSQAVANVNGEIAAAIRDLDLTDQERVDLTLIELDVDLDRRVAARVEDLTALHALDRAHPSCSFARS